MSGADLSRLPEWISSVSSVATLVLAVLGAAVAYRIYKIESGRDEKAETTRQEQNLLLRRAQATMVSAWWGSPDTDSYPPDVGTFIRNASDLPVYQAHIAVVSGTDPQLSVNLDVPVVPPSSSPSFHRARLIGPPLDGGATDVRVAMTFTDSSDRRWFRDQRGRLHECVDALTLLADDRRIRALRHDLDAFGASFQTAVRMRSSPYHNLRQDFLTAARLDTPPDMLIGAHDWLGTLTDQQSLAPIGAVDDYRELFAAVALDALTVDGVLYGIPYAVENLALFRNTTLVPQPPTTIDEMLQVAQRLLLEGHTTELLSLPIGDHGDPYHLFPLYAAGGGDLFTCSGNAGHDPAEIPFDSAASIRSLTMLAEYGERGRGLLKTSINHRNAVPLFASRYTPFLISGPWAVPDLIAAGTPFGVSAIPGYQPDVPATPFLGVQGFFLAAGSGNTTLAHQFLTATLTRTEVALRLYREEPRIPALRTAQQAIGRDPHYQGFLAAGRGGVLMPAFPGMEKVWQVIGQAQQAIIAGAEVRHTATAAARDLRRLRRTT